MEVLGKVKMECTEHKEPERGCISCEFLRHLNHEMEQMRKKRQGLIWALIPFLTERRITIVGLV